MVWAKKIFLENSSPLFGFFGFEDEKSYSEKKLESEKNKNSSPLFDLLNYSGNHCPLFNIW